jgi:hypothetical protein
LKNQPSSHDEEEQARDESRHGKQSMANESVRKFEVVEDAGQKQAPAGRNENRPPAEEGDAPTAGVWVPLEGTVVRRCERDPYKQAAEADVLDGTVVAHVGSTETKTEEELGREDDPGDSGLPGVPGFAVCEPERKQKQDGDDHERGFKLTRASGPTSIGVDGRVKVGARRNVDENRHSQQKSKTDKLRSP